MADSLSKKQFGFKRSTSTEKALQKIAHIIANEIPGYLQAFTDDLVTLAQGSDTGVIWQRTQKPSTLLRNGATPKESTLAH